MPGKGSFSGHLVTIRSTAQAIGHLWVGPTNFQSQRTDEVIKLPERYPQNDDPIGSSLILKVILTHPAKPLTTNSK
jgi:hypothetical protein